MKTAVIIVALFGIVFADPVKLSFNDCELLDVDATLTANAVNGTGTPTAEVTTSTTDTMVLTGSCTGNLRTLAVYFNRSETKLTFTFSLNAQNMVTLNTMVQADAKSLFPNSDFTGAIISVQQPSLTLSSPNNSYLCNTEQTLAFQDTTVNGVDYEMSLAVKGLQVQAYNLPANGFSEAEECSQDDVTTNEPTTGGPTTAPQDTTTQERSTAEPTTSGGSTPEPETTSPGATTQEPTTTETPVPTVTYTVGEGNETCVKMVAAIQLMIDYETTDNQTKTVTIIVPASAKADGTCGNGTDTNATLTVMFGGDSIEFMFEDQNNEAMIDMVNLTYTLTPAQFPNAKDANKTMSTTSSEQIAKTNDQDFYKCTVGNEVKFDSATMMVTDFQVQAFNLKDGDFSGSATECAGDMSTSTPTPGSSTTPIPTPSGPAVNNYTATNGSVTCLMMQASLVLDITYPTTEGKMETVELAVPSGAKFTGTCGNSVETMMIEPFDNWEIEMIFSTVAQLDASDVGADDDEYQLANLTVTYVYDGNLPNNNQTGKTVTVNTAVDKFEAPVKGSYKCNANVTIDLGSDVKLKTSNFRYQAFQTSNSTEFNSGDLQECNGDIETNSIVPIAVGAALAGLVVIVLIAYLIGRRKSRRQGYESV